MTNSPPHKPPYVKPHHHPKLSIYLISTFVVVFLLFHIHSLHIQPPPPSTSLPPPNQSIQSLPDEMAEKLRQSVTFLPLKDLRYAQTALQGHTWFMSSMYDSHQEGEVQYQQFPSNSSKNRLLCLKGRDKHDGSWNSYALAWLESLPINATLMKGLTFISYNHYDYGNIWHGLSAVMPFVAWHKKNGCEKPERWILYHWGEIRSKMGAWLGLLMEATFDKAPLIETFDEVGEDEPVCFEKAVVMRHNEGGMSRERRMEVYDLMRCKARLYCNVSLHRGVEDPLIGMTLFMRTGPRSFKNDSEVIKIFQRECGKVDGCSLTVAYSNNLSFCEQVKLMRITDVLVSPHGAQLTNMFLMDRSSSVMEFFPKGWLKLAGIGQYVYNWIASWSGMRHRGAWRDPDGESCPYPEDDRRCMAIYKNGRIGQNDTHFSEWSKSILNEAKTRKNDEAKVGSGFFPSFYGCSCGQ